MKIAITQRPYEIKGITHDCLDPKWYDLLAPHEVVAVPNVKNIELSESIDMFILTGGENTVSRKDVETMCVAHAIKHNKPILGVCHGAFFLNYLYNGINAPIEGHRNGEHPIYLGGQLFMVNSYHDMGIYELGPELKATAFTKENQIEAFKHKELPIWGIVWHPERMKIPVLPPLFLKLLQERND